MPAGTAALVVVGSAAPALTTLCPGLPLIGVPFKVIIEIGVLSDEQIVTAAKLVADCGADFVKTCTGFGPGRATVHAIGLIKSVIGDNVGIKASGGVASIEDGVYFMRAGATVVAMRKYLVEQLRGLDSSK